MHNDKPAGIPIGQGVTLVIAKKMAAGPSGYADFGTGPEFPAMPEPEQAGHAKPAESSELGGEIRAISERLCEIATEMGSPKGEMPGDEGPEEAESPDDKTGKKHELH